MPLTTSKVYRCSIRSLIRGVQMVNVLHFHVGADTFADADAASFAGDLWSAIGGAYRQLVATDDTVEDLTVTEEVDPASLVAPVSAIHAIAAFGTRSVADKKLPQELTQILALRTDTRARYGRGRQWLPPPLATASLDGSGLIDAGSTYGLAVAGYRTALLSTIAGGTGVLGTDFSAELVVFSRHRYRAGAPTWWFDVKDIGVSSTPHWLRSRRS